MNLAYLMVTFPMLVARFRRRRAYSRPAAPPTTEAGDRPAGLFSMGRFGLPVNAIAVVWGVFVVMNISWPRPEIYGTGPLGPLRGSPGTLALLVVGAVYYQFVQRRKTGILAEHAWSRRWWT